MEGSTAANALLHFHDDDGFAAPQANEALTMPPAAMSFADCVDDEPAHDHGRSSDAPWLSYGEIHNGFVQRVAMKDGKEKGLVVLIGGTACFAPGRQVRGPLSKWVGKSIPVMRVIPSKSSRTPVLSYSAAYERLRGDFLNDIKARMSRGQVELPGIVERYSQHNGEIIGAVIRFDDVNTGFVHKSKMSYNRTVGVAEALPIGKSVLASVAEIDLKKDMVKLTTRNATIPWDAIERVNPGDVLEGTVFLALVHKGQKKGGRGDLLKGLLVALPSQMVGFIPGSDLKHFGDVAGRLPNGSSVRVVATGKDVKTGQIKVGLEPTLIPIHERLAGQVGQEFDVVVSSIQDFGAFVALDSLVDGLVHRDSLKQLGDMNAIKPGTPMKVRLTRVSDKGQGLKKFTCSPV